MKDLKRTYKNQSKTNKRKEKKKKKNIEKKKDYSHCKRLVTSTAEINFKKKLKEIPFVLLNYYKAYAFSLLNVFLGKHNVIQQNKQNQQKKQKKQKKTHKNLQKFQKQNLQQNKNQITSFIHDQTSTLKSIIDVQNNDPFPDDEFYKQKNERFFENNQMINYLIHSIEHGFDLWSNKKGGFTINQIELRCFVIGSLLLMGAKIQYAEKLPKQYNKLIKRLLENNRFVNKKLLNYLQSHWSFIITQVYQQLYSNILKNQQQNNHQPQQQIQQQQNDKSRTKKTLLEKIHYKRHKRLKQRRSPRRKNKKHVNSQLIILKKKVKENQYQMAFAFAYYIFYAMKCTNVTLSLDKKDYLWEKQESKNTLTDQEIFRVMNLGQKN